MSSNGIAHGITPRVPAGPLKAALGEGVKRLPAAATRAPEKPEFQEEPAPNGQTPWSDSPTFVDQFANPKYMGCWRFGPMKIDQFNVGDPKDLERFDALMSQTIPETAPKIILSGEATREFYAGHFFICVSYQHIQYKRLVSTK